MTASDHLGMQFKHTQPSKGYHQISAIHGDTEVGWLGWHGDTPSEYVAPGEITALGVASEYQHKGIATEMYNQANAVSPVPVTHSAKRTRAGEGWANKVGGPILPLRPQGHMADVEPPPLRRL